MGHVVLLGDSIFDNARYVPGGPSVIEHLRRGLPRDWRATLLAVDGSVVSSVPGQLARVPADATHLVVSVGGNNALDYSMMILKEPARSYLEVLTRLGEIREEFQREYRTMLQRVIQLGHPTVICTIYDAIPGLDPSERTGLCVFNDVITREAFRAAVSIIDLRLICNAQTDYASTSPIEPSAYGGGKIARAVIRAVTEDSSADGSIRVYA
jgi:hypothetical protein